MVGLTYSQLKGVPCRDGAGRRPTADLSPIIVEDLFILEDQDA